MDEERYSRGQVAEAALTPETRTERRELSMVNLGGGMSRLARPVHHYRSRCAAQVVLECLCG